MIHHPKIIELQRVWWMTWRKCTENLVERMSKINMKLIKCRKRNSRVRYIGAQFFQEVQKNEEFSFFLKISFFILILIIFWNWFFLKRHSTSPPCGNQVDGLPHDVHSKTPSGTASPRPESDPKTTTRTLWPPTELRTFFLFLRIQFSKEAVGENVSGNSRNSFEYEVEALFGENSYNRKVIQVPVFFWSWHFSRCQRWASAAVP